MPAEASIDSRVYDDDPEHPIPYVDHLDMVAKRKAGGADLIVVIAAPLHADQKSLLRLMRKFDNYLGFISSAEYRREFGKPIPANTRILVEIEPNSDREVFDVLEKCKPWMLDNNTTLVVELNGQGRRGDERP